MKSSELTYSTGRTARRLTTALLATAALALLPAAARAEAPATGYCMRRSTRSSGPARIGRGCAVARTPPAKSSTSARPKARSRSSGASLRGRSQDDEVRVKVIRKAPEGSTASTGEEETAPAQKQASATQESHTKRVVVVNKGALPACQDHH